MLQATNSKHPRKPSKTSGKRAAAPKKSGMHMQRARPTRRAPTTFGGRLQRLLAANLFGQLYAVMAVAALLLSTTWWAVLGAHVQASNADQLVDAYMFGNGATFRGALFPGAHTFLCKWPLFWLIRLFGFSPTVFTVVTVGVVLLTVGGFAYVLYKIEQRPLLFGTMCLALASMLFLVPPQPYPGAFIPVNMAMVTTRNLEYLVYIIAIALFVRTPRFRAWRFWLASGLLAMLFASDKLFFAISLVGGAAATVVYSLARRRALAVLFLRWLLVSGLSAGLAMGILFAINHAGLTHVVNQSATSPYNATHSVHTLLLAVVYMALDFVTNFGANPADGTTILRHMPHDAMQRLTSLSGLSFVINFCLLLGLLVLSYRAFCRSFARPNVIRKKQDLPDVPAALSITLLWVSLAAAAIFIGTDHYYAVDARYLAVAVFAVFVAAASVVRGRKLRAEVLVGVGCLCLLAMAVAIPSVAKTAADEQQSLADVNARNSLIVQAMAHHQTSVLVGDYWRVVPIKAAAAKRDLPVLPLANCTQARQVLTSLAWQASLKQQSFAYLLSFDRSLTDYPTCSLISIEKAYGRPDASVLIAGTASQPKEVLLFYDGGTRPYSTASPKQTLRSANPVLPVALGNLTAPSCNGKTIMQIVAHQDDDLLFMSPDLLHDFNAGNCIRTVYVTAGDSGFGKFYWLSREQGSEAAYDYMDGPTHDAWIQRTIKLADHQFVTAARPRNSSASTLIFMHLPDGNTNGAGFVTSQHESLARLYAGKIASVQTVDGQSSYTSQQLVAALSNLLAFYHPAEIRTQANYISKKYPDHSDHMTVGSYVKQAYESYKKQLSVDQAPAQLKFYIGYPIHAWQPNVSDGDLAMKQETFLQYAKLDGAVCHTVEQCNNTAYGTYLKREYQNDY